jgi:hypothetical protein
MRSIRDVLDPLHSRHLASVLTVGYAKSTLSPSWKTREIVALDIPLSRRYDVSLHYKRKPPHLNQTSVVRYQWLIIYDQVWVFSWIRLLKPDLIDAGARTSLYIDNGKGPLDPTLFGRAVPFVAASKFSDAILVSTNLSTIMWSPSLTRDHQTYRLWIITRRSTRMMTFPILVWIGFFSNNFSNFLHISTLLTRIKLHSWLYLWCMWTTRSSRCQGFLFWYAFLYRAYYQFSIFWVKFGSTYTVKFECILHR